MSLISFILSDDTKIYITKEHILYVDIDDVSDDVNEHHVEIVFENGHRIEFVGKNADIIRDGLSGFLTK